MAFTQDLLLQNLELVPVFLLAWLAWTVKGIPEQGNSNRLLAAFLGTVAFGFIMEYAWVVAREASMPLLAEPLRFMQFLAGMADPLILLALAYSHWMPACRQSNHPMPLVVFVAPFPFVILVWALVESPWNLHFNNIYVNGAYLAAFVLLLDAYGAERGHFLKRQLRFLAWGVGFVALTRLTSLVWAPLFWPLGQALSSVWWTFLALLVSLMGMTLALIFALLRTLRPSCALPFRQLVLPLILSLATFVAALVAFWTPGSGLNLGLPITGFYYNVRWLFFVFIIGYGVLRSQFFQPAYIHQASAVLVAVPIAVIASFSAGAFLQPWDRLTGIGMSLLITSATLPTLFFVARKAFAHLAPDAAVGRDRRERLLMVYEAALECAAQKVEWSEEETQFVATLRQACGLTTKEHESLLKALRGGRTGLR